MYQQDRKIEIARAMDVPIKSVDLYYAAWAAIREAFDRGDLVGTRKLIDALAKD